MQFMYCRLGLLILPFISCQQASAFLKGSLVADSVQIQKNERSGSSSIVFRSADNGNSWQDISAGLPEAVLPGIGEGNFEFFADEIGLWLTRGKEAYQSKPFSTAPYWIKGYLPNEYSSVASIKARLFAYKYWGVALKQADGTIVWSPVFHHFSEPRIRSIFETVAGTLFLGTDKGLFKTTDKGKTWKQVFAGELVGNLAERNGILVATSNGKIIRSADNGNTWTTISLSGCEALDLKPINAGFAAITKAAAPDARRVKLSYDNGLSWQPIDAALNDRTFIDSTWRPATNNLLAQASVNSVIKLGTHYYCTHPKGIFKSADEGVSWELVLPSVEGKIFQLAVSGNVLYAIPRNAGC
ncbi:MAG: exo-alpha-sialidase [Bacteroidetes bacterium]|nr:MAG: exo-alpha-sialidase [Bacteroidota bacterium]